MIPTLKQIMDQKSILSEKAGHTALLSLEDVEDLYEKNKAIPEGEDEPYAIGFGKREVPKKGGEAGETEWQFFLVFSTKRLMKKQRGSTIVQADATYKLNLLGYPVLVIPLPLNYLVFAFITRVCRWLAFLTRARYFIRRQLGSALQKANSRTRDSSKPSSSQIHCANTVRR